MKGILICGGTGSRLRPLTEVTNKSLLPVYDKPLVLYPLQVLLDARVRDIIIITGNEHVDQMAGFLGSGQRFGCRFSYRVQDTAGGIAQALGMAEDFAAGDDVCAILGDNIYFDSLAPFIGSFQGGGHVFLKQVSDAQRFGIAEIERSRKNGDFSVLSIEEKPRKPKSDYAVTGCYVYDNRCFEIIRNLKPSPRGELEITDVSNWYASRGKLTATVLEDEWIDAGTFESLYRSASTVRQRMLEEAEKAKTTIIRKRQQKPGMAAARR